jgi:hypothetical protein
MAHTRHSRHRFNDWECVRQRCRAEGGSWRQGWGLVIGARADVQGERTTLSMRGSASRSWQAAGPGLRLYQLAPMAYSVRHQGLVLSRTGSPVIDMPFGWVEEIGRQLSERSCAAASAVAGSLSEDVLDRLLLSDTLADATRLLEAAPVSRPSPRRQTQSPLHETFCRE